LGGVVVAIKYVLLMVTAISLEDKSMFSLLTTSIDEFKLHRTSVDILRSQSLT